MYILLLELFWLQLRKLHGEIALYAILLSHMKRTPSYNHMEKADFLSHLNSVQKETKVITHSICIMYRMYVACMYVVICKIDHCIHIHWCFPMELGHNDPWVESHMWPQQMWGQRSSRVNDIWFKFLQKRSLYPHTLMQWCLGRVTHVTSTDVWSKVI